jgi:glyoxylase-like metal-dependent hydrolase (beta-lactamase superfamily II)
MKSFRLAVLSLAVAATAFAAPLKVEVFTAGPDGFLVTSTLVSGEKDAVLIDAQFTLSEAHRLAAKLLESRKNLKTIFITHAHPDHFFGVEVLKAAFPAAEVITTPAALEEMKVLAPAKLAQWKPMFGANLTSAPVLPKAFAGDHLELEGQRLELVALPAGESEAATVVWIPSVKTAIVGDLAYNNVHVWLADADASRREAWLKNLARVKALGPAVVVAGHEVPDAKRTVAVLDDTAAYIKDFNAVLTSSKTAEEVEKKMLAKHGKRQLAVILNIAAKAAVPGPKT